MMTSSAEVERLFSMCGLVMTARRSRLGPEKEELFFLAANTAAKEWRANAELGSCAADVMESVFGVEDEDD